MNGSVFQFRKHSFYALLLSLCLSFGLACPLHLILGLTPRPLLVLGISLGVSLLFFLSRGIRHLKLLPYPVILGFSGFILFIHRGDAVPFWNALILTLNGSPAPLSAWSYPLTILLTLFLSTVACAVAAGEEPYLSILPLSLLIFIPIAMGKSGISPLWLLPCILAILLSFRESSTRYLASILSAAAAIALAMLIMPLLPSGNSALESVAGNVRKAIDDYLFFTDARTTFSLFSTGWQPYGANRLGGKVSPSDSKVMQVFASGPVLLRGTALNEYDGFSWQDTIGGRRYLFIDPRFITLRRNLFDSNRPAKSISARFPAEESIRVYMESDSTSTLFVTQRFSSLSGQGIVPYFSPASELFATDSLTADTLYDFNGIRLTAQTEGIRDLVLDAAATSDSWLEETIREQYLSVPEIVEEDVYRLAGEITSNARTDFDRALALSTYLATHYQYTLDQGEPPASRDFVSWFLLTEKRGYCTSFASSLAILARTIGLPARYIEGYSARPGQDGIAYVTQENAHAWCEIYFSGFGWLPFDPTPGPNSGTDNSGQSLPGNSPSPSPSPSPSQSPSPSPPPDATPTPSPSPANSQDPSPTLSPTPTPTPTPEPTPTVPPKDPENEDNPQDRRIFFLLLIFLLLLLLVALAALRLYTSTPAYLCQRQKGRRNALLVYYAAVLQVLHCMRIHPDNGEAPATFLARIPGLLPEPIRTDAFSDSVCHAGYSPRKPSRKELEQAEEFYRSLTGQMSIPARLRLLKDRLLHGLPMKSLS